jgi:hypothetical protein
MDVNDLHDNSMVFTLVSSDGCEQLWTDPNSPPKLPSMIHLLAFLPFRNVLCRQAGRVWKHDRSQSRTKLCTKVFQVRQIINPNLQNMELTPPPHTIPTFLLATNNVHFTFQCLFAFVSCSRFSKNKVDTSHNSKRIKC